VALFEMVFMKKATKCFNRGFFTVLVFGDLAGIRPSLGSNDRLHARRLFAVAVQAEVSENYVMDCWPHNISCTFSRCRMDKNHFDQFFPT